jgi:hypothetical protein
MEILGKFQLIWKCQSGTSFTELSNGQKLEKIAVGEWIDEWSWFLVSMSDLSMLITMKNFSSNRSRVQALPLQTENLDRICKWMLCSNFELWDLDSDGNGEDMDRRSSTIYLGFFLTTKMVVPLERPQIKILA